MRNPSVVELLSRSDAELLAADLAGEAGERFVHAHLAALRAGAAVVAGLGRTGRSRAPRAVWDLVADVAPELGDWTVRFAAAAATRSGIETGRIEVDDERADLAAVDASGFTEHVRAVLTERGVLDAPDGFATLRAS